MGFVAGHTEDCHDACGARTRVRSTTMADRHARGDHAHHSHDDGGHAHDHSTLSREIVQNRRAIRAVWVSAIGLGATAAVQFAIVAVSGSVGLLSDALHNLGDVLGTLTLWVALSLARRPATSTYPFGWQRAEDLGGLIIVAAIAVSAVVAGWESFDALFGDDHVLRNLPLAFAAALIGVAGNEGVARYKIRVGNEIDSPALIADGQHARTDSLASLGAAVGILGAWLGLEQADAIAGLVITATIVYILIDVGRDVLRRLADGVRPGTLESIRAAASGVAGVVDAHDARARHAGRALLAQVHIEVDGDLSVREGHAIGEAVRLAVVQANPAVTAVEVHVDPAGEDDDAHRVMDDRHPDVGGR